MDRKSKTKEITADPKVKALLDAGHIVCVDVKETKNAEIMSVCLIGSVEGVNSNSVNDLKAALMGWNKRFERCIESVDSTIVQGLNSGDSFTDFVKEKLDFIPGIQVEDGFTPNYPTDTPRATTDGELLVDSITGKEVYRKKTIVPANSIVHNTKKVIVQSKYAVLESKVDEKQVTA